MQNYVKMAKVVYFNFVYLMNGGSLRINLLLINVLMYIIQRFGMILAIIVYIRKNLDKILLMNVEIKGSSLSNTLV